MPASKCSMWEKFQQRGLALHRDHMLEAHQMAHCKSVGLESNWKEMRLDKQDVTGNGIVGHV